MVYQTLLLFDVLLAQSTNSTIGVELSADDIKPKLGVDGHDDWQTLNSTNSTSNDLVGKDGHGLPPAWLNNGTN